MYVQEYFTYRFDHSPESITIHSSDSALISSGMAWAAAAAAAAKHKRKTFDKFPGPATEFACVPSARGSTQSPSSDWSSGCLIDNGFIAAKPSALTFDSRQQRYSSCCYVPRVGGWLASRVAKVKKFGFVSIIRLPVLLVSQTQLNRITIRRGRNSALDRGDCELYAI